MGNSTEHRLCAICNNRHPGVAHIWTNEPKKSEAPAHSRKVAIADRKAATGFESPRASNEGLASPAKGRDADTANIKDAPNNDGKAQKVERRSPKPKAVSSILTTVATAGSSNGRTAPFEGVNAGSTPAPATIPNPKRGRPKTITDMGAYKAEKQRQYRLRKNDRADIKAGIRIPKPKGK